ncbi:hypothetical protein HHK36_023035 [Tetracentron sinense]|uniref:Glycoside hydrolase family 3 C-terminal domain-containing protein n=1 Tax=Tetracentron sinense TaxID=13715 RepID=A0A835D7C5_TETSI|nr:hypothetical protein HHK36_023035 [Tetracentron sinense]
MFVSTVPRDDPFDESPSPSPSSTPKVKSNFTYVCDPSRFDDLGLDITTVSYCDTSLPFIVRAKDLVDQMTLSEKVRQIGDLAYGVPRIGLPKYEWWSEALHGVSDVGPGTHFDELIPGATSFPTVILTTASFNESLWKNIGQVVSTEARAMYNLGRARLTYWSPNINVVRDPRWGRITETPENAVMQGKVRENEIDKSLNYLYVMLMRLGFFDGSPSFISLGKENVCSDEHIELAIEAAREGIVLLKNDNDTLPLSSNNFKNLAVIGPHANATKVMVGNYAGIPCQYSSPLDAFSAIANVTYEIGCDVMCKNETLIFPAMQVAKNADATILFVGLDLSVEAESLDRVDLLLPGYQTQLINQVAAVAKGPLILVIMSTGGVDISFAKNNPNIKAILWVGYPGEEGGRAISDIVFGKYNPGGRLPLTWHKADYVDQLPMTSMPLRPVEESGYPGRTYKFFNGSTVYPFGYGLSYTKFNYQITTSQRSLDIKLDKYQHCRDLTFEDGAYRPSCPAVLVDDMSCNDEFEFEVAVQNVGSKDGNEVVMV